MNIQLDGEIMDLPIKFCVFTDLHYDVIPDADRQICELIQDCKQKNVDFIVELGGFM